MIALDITPPGNKFREVYWNEREILLSYIKE